MRAFAVLALSAVLVIQLFPQNLGKGRLLISPDDPERRAAWSALFDDSLAAAARMYGQAGLRLAAPEQAEWLADLIVAEESGVLDLRRAGTEETSASFAFFDPDPRASGGAVANGLGWLWASRSNFLAGRTSRPPVPLDELSVDALLRFIPFPSGIAPPRLYPSGLAVLDDGRLELALGVLCLELDPFHRILAQPGRGMYDRETRYYAFKVSATPGGSLWLASSMDGDVYRLTPGAETPRRVRTGLANVLALQALADGSVVVPDLVQRKAWRLDGTKRAEFPLYAGKNSYPLALAAGPDGTLWAFDGPARLVKVYSAGGELLSSIAPLAPAEALTGMQALAVLRNGDFVLAGGRGLHGFTRTGMPRWSLPDAGLAINSLAVDSRHGLVIMADLANRRLVRLYDREWAAGQGLSDRRFDGLAGISLRLAAAPDDPVLLKERARFFEELGAGEAAYAGYAAAREADPADAEAAERVDAVDAAQVLRQAAALAENAERTLQRIGLESARTLYSQALQAYEGYLARKPGDAAARASMDRLKRLFQGKNAAPAPAPDELVVEKASVENLFPALLAVYRGRPAGRVTVRNVSSGELRAVTARLMIKSYMDFPAESPPVAVLPAGRTAELPLSAPLNAEALSLQEDLPVQAALEVVWRGPDGRSGTAGRSLPLVIYRQTALTWDDTAKLAAFVTPNEETVSGFAHRALAGSDDKRSGPVVSRLFGRALRLVETLGLYGLAYVPDPVTPVTASFGRRETIDTVRFPRTTLALRAGDCDDTSALMASLLESIGIETAILTTPGHVLIAFDSGEPASARRQLELAPYVFLEREGRLWVPIETTELSGGFLGAWKAGAELVERNRAGLEFIPLKQARLRYPALPLPPAALTIIEPAEARVTARAEAALAGLAANIMQPLAGRYEREAAAARPEEAARLLNAAAGVRARFGDLAGAAGMLKGVAARAPGYKPAELNLAVLERLMSGEGAPAVLTGRPEEAGRAAAADERAALSWQE